MSLEAPSTGSDSASSESTSSQAARLIREHQAAVWRYLRVLGCQPAQAEDLTQETFLAVLQRPFVDQGPRATSAYLRMVAKNLLISARRRSSRFTLVENLDEVGRQWEQFARDDGGDEAVEALRDCLVQLDERSRQSLELRFRQHKSRAEIAAAMGMSEDGAKNLMQRAKQRLRECIERKIKSPTTEP